MICGTVTSVITSLKPFYNGSSITPSALGAQVPEAIQKKMLAFRSRYPIIALQLSLTFKEYCVGQAIASIATPRI
jgi:hypothetical protein